MHISVMCIVPAIIYSSYYIIVTSWLFIIQHERVGSRSSIQHKVQPSAVCSFETPPSHTVLLAQYTKNHGITNLLYFQWAKASSSGKVHIMHMAYTPGVVVTLVLHGEYSTVSSFDQ